MGLGDDLTAEALADHLPGRAVRAYPALVSTEADALAWARAGAPDGAVVVSDYQASARGRAGYPWVVQPGTSLGFSLVLRPSLPPQREGWLYTIATVGVADALGADLRIEWPDQLVADDRPAAHIAVQAQLPPGGGHGWAVVSMLVAEASPPRGPLLAGIVGSLAATAARPEGDVRTAHRGRCATLGRRVRARLLPVGPTGPQVEGVAVDVLADGALLLDTGQRRVAVRPTHLGVLEDVTDEDVTD